MSKVIYIAGPYETGGKTNRNVADAIVWAEVLRDKGYLPFCPHLFHFWDFYSGHVRDFWMSMCLEWVSKADAVFRIGEESKGADEEVALAEKLGIPVFTTVKDLKRYFNGQ